MKNKKKSDHSGCTEVKITSLERTLLSEWKLREKNAKQKISHKSNSTWP